MPTQVKQIFNGTAQPNSITYTDRFKDTDFLIFNAPDLYADEGYELTGSINIELNVTQVIGGEPITTNYGTKEIGLDIDIIDTNQLLKLPNEATQSRLECRLLLLVAYPVRLDIYALSSSPVIDAIKVLEEAQSLPDDVNTIDELQSIYG